MGAGPVLNACKASTTSQAPILYFDVKCRWVVENKIKPKTLRMLSQCSTTELDPSLKLDTLKPFPRRLHTHSESAEEVVLCK